MYQRRNTIMHGMFGCAAGVMVSAALGAMPVLHAKETSSSSADKEVSRSDLSQVQNKLDQVLANQQTIMQKFDAIMDELRIIKVRASTR